MCLGRGCCGAGALARGRRPRRPFGGSRGTRAWSCVPSMFGDLWGANPHPNLMEVKGSEAHGPDREGGSERSVEQTRGPMYKNRIRGVSAGRTGNSPQSPYPSKAQSVNSGGCARKVVELTSGDLFCVPDSGLGEPRGDPTAGQKSAEGKVPGDREGPNGPRKGLKGVVSRTRDS
jgi:hypothetical protein